MQAAGWIVIILFGFVFALLAVFLVRQCSLKTLAHIYAPSKEGRSLSRKLPHGFLCVLSCNSRLRQAAEQYRI